MLNQGCVVPEEKGPREEFKQVDTRPVHELNKLIPLDEVRKARQCNLDENVTSTSYGALPRLRSPGTPGGDRRSSSPQSPWSPLAAAKQQLQNEKPDIYSRMERTKAQCKIARGNRKYRLDSLGVFDAEVNQTRSRSMFKVQMHQELSPVSMRLPQHLKDVRPTIIDDNINHKLERMFQRVVHSLEEPKRPPAKKITSVRRSRPGGISHSETCSPAWQQQGEPHHAPCLRSLESMAPSLSHSMSPEPGKESFHHTSSRSQRACDSMRPPGSPLHQDLSYHSPSQISLFSTSQRDVASQASMKRGKKTLEWSKTMVPPEVAEAKLQHLADKTQGHLERYHQAVVRAQEQLLVQQGLDPDLLGCGPGEVEAQLMGVIAEIEEANKQRIDESTMKEVSRRLQHAENAADLISAALEHVGFMQEDLQQLKKSLPQEHSMKAPVRRRRTFIAPKDPSAASQLPSGMSNTELLDAGQWDMTPDLNLEDGDEASGPMRYASRRSRASRSTTTAAAGKADGAAAAAVVAVAKASMPPAPPLISKQRLGDFEARLQGIQDREEQPPVKDLAPLPAAPNASLALQARLERIWTMLDMPLVKRLDMVLEYTRRDRVLQFEKGLDAWEKAAAAVVQREELLSQLVDIQQGLEQGTLPVVSILSVERLCCSIVQVTCQAQALALQLKEECGSTLEYDGRPYPGEGEGVVGVPHLVKLLEYMQSYDGPVKLTSS